MHYKQTKDKRRKAGWIWDGVGWWYPWERMVQGEGHGVWAL